MYFLKLNLTRQIFNCIAILCCNFYFSQNRFSIEIKAPELEKDSLYIGFGESPKSILKILDYTIDSKQNVKFFKEHRSAIIKVNSKTIVDGDTSIPQPLVISYFSSKTKRNYESNPIFINKNHYSISGMLSDQLHVELEKDDEINKEYKTLKKGLKIFDDQLKPWEENDSTLIEDKQKFLQNYIKNNEGSFVAFWEVVKDFSYYGFNESYLRTLDLFSSHVKKSYSYKEFYKMMEIERSTNVGGNFPIVTFENGKKIDKSTFSNYKLTLIDYWATHCKPCIKDLPKLVALYEKYKDKGLNLISVADGNQNSKIELAKSILMKNKVNWNNYFDTTKVFPKKLNASGYPLQILVDSKGKIIARKFGNLDDIEKEIDTYNVSK